LILLGIPIRGGRFIELRPIYQGCRALTFALARLSCYIRYIRCYICVVVDFSHDQVNSFSTNHTTTHGKLQNKNLQDFKACAIYDNVQFSYTNKVVCSRDRRGWWWAEDEPSWVRGKPAERRNTRRPPRRLQPSLQRMRDSSL